ncbi:MAG: UDP-N-acetylmuramoyl-L-alanine--D-glutamate ligase [Eubacterium sp.]|nr:UDP-N-acetylmuramoyl-L-alanine--D-glutamate ligase [Eubacterium sp.]
MKDFELKDKKVLVFGSGKSGIGAARLLLAKGAVPIIYDGNTSADQEAVRQKIGQAVDVILGELPAEIEDQLDLVVMSPGVPCDIPVVKSFYDRGIPVWGEVELAWRIGKGKVLAVTGTNGKTTTVTLLGEIMKNYYPEVYVVGNIGTPYTDVVLQQSDKAWTVAEVSSFQMETIDQFHPAASAITNITEDHLNRHHTMEEYIRCKERIAENQTADDICVLNYEDPVLRDFGGRVKARVVYFSSHRVLDEGIYLEDGTIRIAKGGQVLPVVRTDELQILGLHNFENVMVAVAMAYHAGVPLESIRKTVCAFQGVEHRIEFVTEINGVRYYNDSKGTNPDAAIKGIQAMNRPTCLIGGGFDKQLAFDDWIRAFDGKVKFFALIGQTRETIAETAVRLGFPKEKIAFFDNLEEATKACAAHAVPGDAVLLSPACASWGQFDNYEQRGEMFKQYVRELGRQ